MDKFELVKYALENGIINLSSIQNDIETKKKNQYLEKHTYRIWQGTNGKWYTYLPDEDKGRKLIKRTSEKDIQDVIVKFYDETNDEAMKEKETHKMTLKNLYYDWIKYKSLHTTSSSYIRRINSDWKTFYVHDEISDIPIRKLKKVLLDEWAHRLIKQHNMSKTKYYNMSVILRQALDYAKDCGYIDYNYFNDVVVDPKMFRGKKKINSQKEVFLTDEEPIMKEYCKKKHENNPRNTTPLAILLMFELGCRVGELVALCKDDINGNYIHISRQEIAEYNLESGNYEYMGTKVVPYTKSDCGDRNVYLSREARRIVADIIDINNRYGFLENDYLILNRLGRTKGVTINRRLGEYCKASGISHKSTHKIRKTYISKMIDGNINIKTIMQQAGHVSAKTTYSNYCFDRNTESEIEYKIEEILSR
ncbi:MAG: tyrosine-type recombinase/integrase [Clostridiales bacterium]|nr:tyrosine-type recombinase/integrase [Clostridiales bacterium]